MNSQEFGGPWSTIKVELLRKYLHFYTQALKNKPFKLIYIDAFAGTGYFQTKKKNCQKQGFFSAPQKETGQQLLDGSAKIALSLERPFDFYIFIEKDEKKFSELQKLKKEFPSLETRMHFKNTDANEYLKSLCNKVKWSNHRSVLFLDPFGLQVDWTTIEAIANTRSIDTWFLFPISAINRMLKRDGNISESWKRRINSVFGTDNWYNKFFKKSRQMSLFGTTETLRKEADFQIIGEYILERLQTVFAGVAKNPRLLRTERNVPLFLLCFAVGNPNAKAKKLALNAAQNILSK
ncbi:MAG: three-Cys-motif partner protein TcmP [Thermodesulfobacteriota bacterium]|nr:three-Cys-motif partner protein TcmP [Thermodesulfobacteriota bacterium]